MADHRVVRIAHAYGNRRDDIVKAVAAAVDMIELDVWHDDGLFVHHERRLRPFPLLIDHLMPGRSLPPLSLPLPRGHYVRLDVNRLSLEEVLEKAVPEKRVLIDTKGRYDGTDPGKFAAALLRAIRKRGAESSVSVCGQFYPVLDAFRQMAPEVEVRYSIENARQWRWFTSLAGREELVRNICIQHRFIDPEKAAFVEQLGINVYCWTVDDRGEAGSLVASGVDGIISNDLELLESLP